MEHLLSLRWPNLFDTKNTIYHVASYVIVVIVMLVFTLMAALMKCSVTDKFMNAIFIKPLCRFLIHRYMGQWLRTEVETDQLEFGLADGRASVQRVSLNTESINEAVEPLGVVSVVEGYVEEVSIGVPWKKLTTDSTVICICGLELTLNPLSDINLSNTSDLVSSVIGSMASSKDLAKSMIEDENLARKVADSGVDQFAGLIDQMIKKIQVVFERVIIRVEANSTLATGMEIQIDKMIFMDDAVKRDETITTQPGSSTEITIINKLVEITGVRIYTDIWTPFRDRQLSISRTTENDESTDDVNFQSCYSTFANRSMIGELTPTTVPSNPVLVAQFLGPTHTVHIQVQTSGLTGNERSACSKNVNIDLEIGGALLFDMTPSQFTLLQNLFSRLIPNKTTTTTVVDQPTADLYGIGRPMRPEHFQKLTEQFHGETFKCNHLHPMAGGGPQRIDDGWGGQEQFFEILSSYSTADAEPTVSSMDTNDFFDNHRDKRTSTTKLVEKHADTFNFKLHCPLMLGAITYKDSLSNKAIRARDAPTEFTAIRETIAEMAEKAKKYFCEVEERVRPFEGLDDVRSVLAAVRQPCDHIRFFSDTTKLNLSTSTELNYKPFQFNVTLQNCDICECLQPTSLKNTENAASHFDLLRFTNGNNAAFTFNLSNSRDKPNDYTIDLSIGNGNSELDPSIIDRLIHIIRPDPCFLFTCNKQQRQKMAARIQAANRALLSHPSALRDAIFDKAIGIDDPTTYSIRVNAKSWIVDIRIPIADLSEGLKEFWKRDVYDEFLRLKLEDAILHIPRFSANDLPVHGSADLRCRSIEGTFVGDPHLMECTADETQFFFADSTPDDRVRLKIDYDTRNKSLKVGGSPPLVDPDASDVSQTSMIIENIVKNLGYKNGPFSQNTEYSETEENLAPMRRHELEKYSANCSEMADLNIELAVPRSNCLLPSRKFFEIIYNRFGNDLALWSARALPSIDQQNHTFFESFSECQNGLKNEIDNDIGVTPIPKYESTNSHNFTFKIKSSDATITLQSNNLCLTGQDDSFSCQLGACLTEAEVFFVYGFNGDANVSHLAMNSATVELFHRNFVDDVMGFPREVIDTSRFMERQPSDVIVEPMTEDEHHDPYRDNFAVGLVLALDTEKNAKLITIAVGLRSTVVYAKPTVRADRLWMRQFADYFNVVDYMVPGYTPPTPNIDLHVALNSVAVDYKHASVVPNSGMQIRFVTSQCYIRSHITEDTERLRLRCEFHDALLWMRKNGDRKRTDAKFHSKWDHDDQVTPIKVMKIDCFNFHVSVATEMSTRQIPIVDFDCGNESMKIWICSDTVVELLKMIVEIQNSSTVFFAFQDKGSSTLSAEQVEQLISSVMNAATNEEQKNKIKELVEMAIRSSYDSQKMPNSASNAAASENINTRQKIDEFDVNFGGSESQLSSPDNDTEDEFIMIEKVAKNRGATKNYLNKSDTNEYDYIQTVPEDASDISFLSETQPIFKYCISDLTVELFLFGGNDFGDAPTPPKTYSCWYDSTSEAVTEESAAAVGGPFRDHTVCVQATFQGISFIYEIFDSSEKILSRHRLRVNSVEWLDHVSNSSIHKMLYMCRDSETLQRTPPMLLLNMSEDSSNEAKLTVSLMNIRLNLDQDTIEFLQDFGTDIKEGLKILNAGAPYIIEPNDPITEVPEFRRKASVSSKSSDDLRFNRNNNGDLINFNDDDESATSATVQMERVFSRPSSSHGGDSLSPAVRDLLSDAINEPPSFSTRAASISSPSNLFIREFTFAPRCKIRFDFVGKRVKTDQGPFIGFIIGMMDLHRSEITLKALHNEKGLLGISKVYEYVEEEWLSDISYRQFADLVSSYRPISSLVQLSKGVRDLFAIPFNEMQKKNGHIVGGIQQGASSFGLNTTTAALNASQHFVMIIQIAAFTSDLVTPDNTYQRQRSIAMARGRTRVAGNMREGFTMAYDTMRDGVYDTTRMLYTAAIEECVNSGSMWNLRNIIRHFTPTVIRPIILTSEAAVHVLNGIKNQLKPDEYREEIDKWRHRIGDRSSSSDTEMEKSPLTYQFAQVPQNTSNTPLSNVDDLDNTSAANRPPLLRRVSQSDPHLDFPKQHFLHDTNYQSSIHNLLTGLFERSLPLSRNLTPLPEYQPNRIDGMDSTFEQQPIGSRLDRNQSALELTSAASSNSLCAEVNAAKPLRKVSSTAYNFAPSDVSSNASTQPSHHHTSVLSHWWNSHIGGGLGGGSTNGSISKIPEEDQGLTMSIGQSSTGSEVPGGSALSAARSAGILDTTGTAEQTPVPDARPRNAHGGLVGILGRGFLGKPVLCNEADNYRYIMALDR